MTDVWNDIAAELSRLLPPRFRRSRLTFKYLQNPEVVRTVAISKFRWNTPGQSRFQLILGIYLATEGAGEFTFPGHTHRFSLVFHKPSGYLWGDETYLYEIPGAPPLDPLCQRLRADVVQHIWPFLEPCNSIDATMRVLDEEKRKSGQNLFAMQLAIALARLGRLDESRTFFHQTPGDPDIVRRVAAQYGVNL